MVNLKINCISKLVKVDLPNLQEVINSVSVDMKFASKVDLKSAFSQFRLSDETSRAMGFKFQDEIFVYKSLPFGYRNASTICQNLVMIVIGNLRLRGFTCHVYIDDIILFAKSAELMRECTDYLHSLLRGINLVLADEKTILCQQEIHYLGMEFNLLSREVNCKTQLEKIRSTVLNTKTEMCRWQLTEIESLIGRLNWLTSVIG